MTMRTIYIIFFSLLPMGALLQANNILDSLLPRADAETEERILKEFRASRCYRNIESGYNFKVQPWYVLSLIGDETVLTDETLFLESLHSVRRCRNRLFRRNRHTNVDPIFLYIIFNDSLQDVAIRPHDRNFFFCHGATDAFHYAMENNYAIFYVSGFPGNIHFGYKNGQLFVFESRGRFGEGLKVLPFAEFDWNQAYLLDWRTSFWNPLLTPQIRIVDRCR